MKPFVLIFGNPYRVFIGVSGAKYILDGVYELNIDLK